MVMTHYEVKLKDEKSSVGDEAAITYRALQNGIRAGPLGILAACFQELLLIGLASDVDQAGDTSPVSRLILKVREMIPVS
jgi:hypothetical protein